MRVIPRSVSLRTRSICSAGLPMRSVEFGHCNSLWELQTTYLGELTSTSVNGLDSAVPVQKPRRSSQVRHPRSTAPGADIDSSAKAIDPSSWYPIDQPPWTNLCRVSSSGRPGACITPSRVTFCKAVIVAMTRFISFSHFVTPSYDERGCGLWTERHSKLIPSFA